MAEEKANTSFDSRNGLDVGKEVAHMGEVDAGVGEGGESSAMGDC